MTQYKEITLEHMMTPLGVSQRTYTYTKQGWSGRGYYDCDTIMYGLDRTLIYQCNDGFCYYSSTGKIIWSDDVVPDSIHTIYFEDMQIITDMLLNGAYYDEIWAAFTL
jgi:hypothetical protein